MDNTPLKIFDDEVLELLSCISSELLNSPLVRQYPDLAAFAFYIRKANLLKLRESLFPSSREDELVSRLGRGLCFHITPGNIPVNFAFSWVFSFLAGNANVVRLPSKSFPQVDALLEAVMRHLAFHPHLAARNEFVRYPRTDTERTATYSSMSDCRMIWGGDRTIVSVRGLPTKPRCVDICFADRYSLAVIDAEAVLAADDRTLRRLAEGFYNDTWLMDQNACSSPQLVCWFRDLPAGRVRFWSEVEAVVREKYVLQESVAVDKFALLCEEAATNPACRGVSRVGNYLYREELSELSPDVVNRRGKAGYFFEYTLSPTPLGRFSFPDLFSVVDERFQTLAYFGIDAIRLREALIDAHVRGIDRIVPIGQAMDIGVIWDGHDLVRELSRIVKA